MDLKTLAKIQKNVEKPMTKKEFLEDLKGITNGILQRLKGEYYFHKARRGIEIGHDLIGYPLSLKLDKKDGKYEWREYITIC
jgi:hypothetical protein